MAYEVRKVRGRRLMNDFLRLPHAVYRGNDHWIRPMAREVCRTLDPSRNPYFRMASVDLFVCYRDGVAAARTALVINEEHCRKFNVHAGFFGFFEAENDREATVALFEAVEEECRTRNIDLLEGPFNPNHYSELGMLEDRFDEDPVFFQTYNPAYYHALLRGTGFAPAEALYTARNPDCRSLGPAPSEDADSQRTDGFAVRNFRMDDFEHECDVVREVFNDAFSSNWHFLPASLEEHLFSAKYLSLVTDPSLVAIVEHRGNAVGVLMCVLDVNPVLKSLGGKSGPLAYLRFRQGRKRLRTLIVYAVGIRKAYQRTRAYVLLSHALHRMAQQFDVLESTWMSPENTLAIAASRRMGMAEYKHFRIYRKALCNGSITRLAA